jgi:hypothetical protein
LLALPGARLLCADLPGKAQVFVVEAKLEPRVTAASFVTGIGKPVDSGR